MDQSIPKFEDCTPVENVPQWEDCTPVESPKFYGPKREDWGKLRAAFAGDPLAVVPQKMRADFEFATSRMENPDQERKKLALTAYFSRMKKENFNFVYGNLDSIMEQYNGQKTTIDQAYSDIAGMLAPQAQKQGWLKPVAKGGFAQLMGTLANLGTTMLEGSLQYENAQQNIQNMGKRAVEIHSDIGRLRNESVGYWRDLSEAERAKVLPADWATADGAKRYGVAGTAKHAVIAILFEAPNMAAQAALGAVNPALVPLAMGMTSANDKMYQLDTELPEMGDGWKIVNVLSTGLINGYLETVTMGILKGSGLKLMPETLKAGFREGLKYYLKSSLKEGVEEVAEQLGENLTDLLTGVYGPLKEMSPADLREHIAAGLPESFIVGGAYGGGFAGMGHYNLRKLEENRLGHLNLLEAEKTRLQAIENPGEQEIAELNTINEILDAGDYRQISEAASRLYLREEAERARARGEKLDADAEKTDEELSLEHLERYSLRHNELAHNPQDTADAAAEAVRAYNNINLQIDFGTEYFSEEAKRQAEQQKIDPDYIRGWYDSRTDTVHINANQVRPSEAGIVIAHEVVGHKGLQFVFGEHFDAMLDQIYEQHIDEFAELNNEYHFDLSTVDGQRGLAEEYLAERAEFSGKDWRRYYAENMAEIDAFMLDHDIRARKSGVLEFMRSNGDLEMRPGKWKAFLQRVRMFLSKRKGFENYRFTDGEIETMIQRGINAMRKRARSSPSGVNEDSSDIRFAALRREGAPNTADLPGQLRDGNVPHKEGFLEENGFDGKGIYADYEFLRGRHPEYFPDVEHVRAAVEFVLDSPEPGGHLLDNFTFIRKDISTGKIFRIEISPKQIGKRHQIRSVHEITERQYEKVKDRLSRSETASPDSVRHEQTLKAGEHPNMKGVGPLESRSFSDFLRYNSTDAGNVKSGTAAGLSDGLDRLDGKIRFALFDNPGKRDSVLDALQKIADGSEEETIPNLRNDLEQYGGTNDITLPWGNLKKGIYHIAYRRGTETLLHVVDALADGKIERYAAGNKTVHLVKDGYEAILSLDEHGKKKSWLLTGWEINKPDAFGKFSTKSEATQTAPTFSRRDLGAGLKQIRMIKSRSDSNISSSGEMSSGGDVKFSISPVYTGSAADYDAPSLQYIGTGEGAQVYGWGLYGSSSEKVARWYAETDAERKNRARILLDGKEPDPEWLDKADLSGEPTEFEIENSVLEDVRRRKGSISGTLEYYRIQMNKPTTRRENPEFYRNCREWLEKNKNRIQYIPENDDLTGRRNLYRQTFFSGKQENLLDWDKPVTEEQQKKIEKRLKEEGLYVEGDPDRASAEYRELKKRKNAGEEVPEAELDAAYKKAARLHIQRNVIGKTINGEISSGSIVYDNLEDLLGDPKAVSEFLSRAGIDGVAYIGGSSGVRNYVAFSDQDIRVDEHIRFSLDQYYSPEDRADIVGFLKPFVGRAMERSDADYLNHLRENGFDIRNEEDAHVFAAEAKSANERDARIRGDKMRDDWLIQNNYWFGKLAEMTGKTDFVIRPSNRFIGEEFTGSFISPEFVKYSADTKKRNRNKKLREAAGYHSDELARMIADRDGGDELQIEQDMIDYFRHKKKRVRNKEERKNGNLGLYDEYSEWKASSPMLNAKLDERLKAEWEAETAARIDDEIIEILTNGTEITEAFAFDNREVFNELYKRIMKKDAPYTPPKRDLDAINAAIRQSGNDAASYARGWKEGRIAMKQKEYREFVQKVLDGKADAMKLQREAIAFSEKHLNREDRGGFTRKIVSLLEYDTRISKKYPEGRRKAELEKLFSDMLKRGEERRHKTLLEQMETRLEELGSRVDGGRKVKGIRDIETQAKLDRIIALSWMSPEMIESEITAAQSQIEIRHENGESTTDLEYDIACAELYGDLKNRSLPELEEASRQLEQLARHGKDELRAEIERRAAEAERIVNECETILRGGHETLSWSERRTLEKKRERRWKLLKMAEENFWESLNLWGMFDICALASGGDERKTPFYRFAQMTHEAARNKDTVNRKHAENTAAEIDSLWKTKDSRGRAAVIMKLRERVEHTGIFRDVPDPEFKHFEYETMTEEEARKALSDGALDDYEEAAVRHQLDGLGKKAKYNPKEELYDGVTDKILQLAQAESESKDPRIIVPRIKNSGNKTELALTQLEALYLSLMWQQKSIRYKMHFNGYSAETMTQIDAFLTPETKQFGAWMVQELEKDHGTIDNVYRKLYFAAFPHEESYFPSVYDPKRNSMNAGGVDLTQEGAGGKASVYSPGALKIRMFHLKEPKIADALTVFQNHRLQMTHFVTHAESARQLRAVFLNPRIREALTDEHGNAMYANLKEAIRDYINGGNVDVRNNTLFQHLHGNFIRSKMIYNITSGMKQTLGGITYAMDIPPAALAKGIADFWTHPKECIRILSESGYLRNRWESGSNADMRILLDATGRSSSGYATFMGKLDTFSSLPLRFGDMVSAVMAGWAVYKHHHDNLIKNGVDRMEAHKAALLEWEMSTERTQQSSHIHMLNKAQRGGGLNRLFTTFLSNQILLYQNYAVRFYDAKHFKRGELAGRGLKTMAAGFLTSAAMTAFTQMFYHGTRFDNWEWLDFLTSALGDYLVGIPWIGPIINQSAQAATGGYGNRMPIVDDISRGMKSGWKVSEEEVEVDEETVKNTLNILQALGYISAPAAHAGAIGREGRKWWNWSKDDGNK